MRVPLPVSFDHARKSLGQDDKNDRLVASLRGKARTILENVENFESLSFSELKSKLELPLEREI